MPKYGSKVKRAFQTAVIQLIRSRNETSFSYRWTLTSPYDSMLNLVKSNLHDEHIVKVWVLFAAHSEYERFKLLQSLLHIAEGVSNVKSLNKVMDDGVDTWEFSVRSVIRMAHFPDLNGWPVRTLVRVPQWLTKNLVGLVRIARLVYRCNFLGLFFCLIRFLFKKHL